MKPRIVTDGLDPLTRPALDYLVSEYGIDPHHIKRIQLDSPAADVQMITVTLLVQQDAKTPSPLRQVPLLRPLECCAICGGPLGDDNCPAECRCSNEAVLGVSQTTCVYEVDAPGGKRPCGELIRKERHVRDVGSPGDPDSTMLGQWEWIHASDGRLGTSAHPATPGY